MKVDDMHILNPLETHFYLDEFAELVISINDQNPVHGVRLTHCFPISAESQYIAVRNDEVELGIINDIETFDPESAAVLNAELSRSYFRPRVVRVFNITEKFHVPRWEVETDRGKRTFEIRSSRRDMRVLGGGRILIRDADGNLFEIVNYFELDALSRSLVETQI